MFSKRSAKRQRISATAVFRLILLQAMDCEEPSMRNSNLLPVKANGDVRLRSLVSWKNFGRLCTSIFRLALLLFSVFLVVDEILDAFFQIMSDEDRQHGRRSLMSAQTMIISGTGGRNTQQFRIFVHCLDDCAQETAGTARRCLMERARFSPSADIDQLLCLPLPLMPSKGFSCSRQTRSCLSAIFFISSITI